MLISHEVTIYQLKDLTYDCDDLWEVVAKQNLWNRLEDYLINCFADETTRTIDLGHVRDVLRYEGGSVLKAIGAKFGGTIWEDIYGCD